MPRTILKDLPYDTKGFATEDEDGEPLVFLNSRYCYEANVQTFRHECQHIEANDLDRSLDIGERECEMHEDF